MRDVRILLAAALFATALPARADPFDEALQDIELAIATPETVVQYCSGRFPEFAAQLHAGLERWRRRHADFLFEIETRAEKATRQKALRDEARYAELVKAREEMLGRYRKGYQADLARSPQAEQEKGCRTYGADLNNGGINLSDLETMMARQLAVLRKRDEGLRRGR